MSSRNLTKRIPRAFARYGLFFSAWIFDRLPARMTDALTHLFIAIAYQLTVKQRRIARESIDIAFGREKSPEENKAIVKKCFTYVGRGMIEVLLYMTRPEETKKNVVIEGQEYLDEALKKGKGVIAVTAHYGNFPLMMLRFAQGGYRTSSIIRPTRDPKVEEYLLRRRTECGLKTVYAVPRQKCVRDSIKVLRDNEILFIPLDQNFGNGHGVFVDFFGQKAATATGPVVLSMRTGAVILPMFILHNEDRTHRIIIEPPLQIEEKASEDETVQHNISRITRMIEHYIRRYPYEWGWMHRRWKSRPRAGQAKS